MARPASKYKGEKGFVQARACLAPCGGEIVLYDHGEAAGADRYVVKHQPSGAHVRTGSRKLARSLYAALAEGRDTRGLLPKVAPPRAQEDRPKTLAAPLAENKKGSRVRARLDEPAKNGAEVELLARTMEAGSHALAAALEAAFPEEWIVGKIRELCEADKSFEQDGNVVTVPDGTTRAKGLALLMDYKFGKSFTRAEVKPAKAMDMSGFYDKLRKSRAFRDTLRGIIDEAEGEAAPVPAEIVATKDP